jgi:hypothetical protein
MEQTTIYTYKSHYGINQDNIHALQDGSTGPLNIGILDTGDYTYTYVSGSSGSFVQNFLPINATDDASAIISNVAGGTGNMLLQNVQSSLIVNNVNLNVQVNKYQDLQVNNVTLNYDKEYIPPLKITEAKLRCSIQSQLMFSNARLNLTLKRKIMNLPVILGMEFNQSIQYSTRRSSDIDRGRYPVIYWNGDRQGENNYIIVIHDPNGANYPAFQNTYDNSGNPVGASTPNRTGSAFRRFQTFTGLRRETDGKNNIAQNSSIIRVRHPFGDPANPYVNYNGPSGLVRGEPNLNNYIIHSKDPYALWFIDNGMIDNEIGTWNKIDDNYTGDQFRWKRYCELNTFFAMVSGNKKLFDHSALYNNFFQSYVDGANGWGGHGGQWLMTTRNGYLCDGLYEAAVRGIFYTTYENYITGNYQLNQTGNQKYTSTGLETSYSEILTMRNVYGVRVNYGLGEDRLGNMDNNKEAVNFPPSGGKTSIKDSEENPARFTRVKTNGEAQPNPAGGSISLAGIYNSDASLRQSAYITTSQSSYDITELIQNYADGNDDTLDINNFQFSSIQSKTTFGVEQFSIVGDVKTPKSRSYNSTILSGANTSTAFRYLLSYVRDITNVWPYGEAIIGTESTFTLTFKYNNRPLTTINLPYSNGGNILINSVYNGGQSIVNADTDLNLPLNIYDICKTSSGTSGSVFNLNNWNLSNITTTSPNLVINNKNYNLGSLLDGKKLIGNTGAYRLIMNGNYDFTSNSFPDTFHGIEYVGITLAIGGTASFSSQELQNLNIVGLTGTIDLTSYFTSKVDKYTQSIDIPTSLFPLGLTGYQTEGVTSLGLTGGFFNPNEMINWQSAYLDLQYTYSLGVSNFDSIDVLDNTGLNTNPISINKNTDNNNIIELKTYSIDPKLIKFPFDPRTVVYFPYGSQGITLNNQPTFKKCIKSLSQGYRQTTLNSLNYFSSVPSTVVVPGLYVIKGSVNLNDDIYINWIDSAGSIRNVATRVLNITPQYIYSELGLPLRDTYGLPIMADVVDLSVYPEFPFNQQVFLYDNIYQKIPDSFQVTRSLNDYPAFGPNTPSIPVFNFDTQTLGRDDLIMDTAKLNIKYSYGDGLNNQDLSTNFNLQGNTSNININSELIVPTNIFTKSQRSIEFPYDQFMNNSMLYFVNIRKNKTGYTFSQTPFSWNIYDPATYLYYQIVKLPTNGFKLDTDIRNLYNLNNYTVNRTQPILFESILDLYNQFPIDLTSRVELENISTIVSNNNQIKSIILDYSSGSTAPVSSPYKHRFFKFDYLSTDYLGVGSTADQQELFLLVTSSTSGSTAILPDGNQLRAEISINNNAPFIRTQDDNTYNLSNKIITFDGNNVNNGDVFSYNNIYLNPTTYGNLQGSYMLDVKGIDSKGIYHSLNTFTLSGSTSTSFICTGLTPNTLYKNNYLTYYPSLNEYRNLTNNSGATYAPPSTTQILNFQFSTNNNGIEFFADKTICAVNPTNPRNYIITLNNFSYKKSQNNNTYNIINNTSPYSLCLDFNDSSVFIDYYVDNTDNVISKSTNGRIIVPFSNINDITFSIYNLERGKTYIPKIYLVVTADTPNFKFSSNRLYMSQFKIPTLPLMNFVFDDAIYSYKKTGTLKNFDVFDKKTTIDYDYVGITGGTLFVLNPDGQIHSEIILEAGRFGPNDYKFSIIELDPNTNYSGYKIYYITDKTTDNIKPLGNTGFCSLTGEILSVGDGSTANVFLNNQHIFDLGNFGTTGTDIGDNMIGTVDIANPIFYNSVLTIQGFDYYRYDPANSFPARYDGIVSVINISTNAVIGLLDLKTALDKRNFSIKLNLDELLFGTIINFKIKYDWKDLNNIDHTGTNFLFYSTKITDDQTSITVYNHTPLYNKIITNISGATGINNVGNTTLSNLKTNLILNLTSSNQMNYRGPFNTNTTYYKNDAVSLLDQGTTGIYWLRGSTSTHGSNNGPLYGFGWINTSDFLTFTSNTGTTANNEFFENNQGVLQRPTNIFRNNNRVYVSPENNSAAVSYSELNEGYRYIFNNCIPDNLYNVYIESFTKVDGSYLQQIGPQSLGIVNTLNNKVYAESLTGNTGGGYILNDFHYSGSTSYFTQGNVFIDGITTSPYMIQSAGITFTDNGYKTDYFSYQPQISIDLNVFDQSANQPIFYSTVFDATSVTVSGLRYDSVLLNINNLQYQGIMPNTNDYLVVKGPSGIPDQTFLLQTAYVPGSNTDLTCRIYGLTENTTYNEGDFKIYYKYASAFDRISDAFIKVPSFTTPVALELSPFFTSGITKIGVIFAQLKINGNINSNLFLRNGAGQECKFYMYVYNNGLPPTRATETDYKILTTNDGLPKSYVLTGASQGVAYDRLYIYYKYLNDDNKIDVIEKSVSFL